jgi:hypothetical protein
MRLKVIGHRSTRSGWCNVCLTAIPVCQGAGEGAVVHGFAHATVNTTKSRLACGALDVKKNVSWNAAIS